MKLHHKESVFLPLDIKTDKPLFHSPELCRRKLQMEEDKFVSSEEEMLRKGKLIRAVRAVLFHIKLRRRNREKRIVSDSMRRSSSSFSFRFRKQNNDENESNPDLPKSASTRSASPSISTSSSSSSSSSSARVSFQSSEPRISVSSAIHQNLKKQSSVKEEGRMQRQRSDASIMTGLVLILMSLGLTILWGRVWAIAFNAVWLACIPQKLGLSLTKVELGSDDDDEVVETVEESVKDARRRVIMEGLLDRRHHRQSWQQHRKL